jgi:hypothetical protein
MPMPMPMPETLSLNVRRVAPTPMQPALAVQKFNFVRVGSEILLEACTLDLQQLRDIAVAIEKAGKPPELPPTVDMYVIARFSLSPQAALDLVSVVKELEADLQRGLMPVLASIGSEKVQ